MILSHFNLTKTLIFSIKLFLQFKLILVLQFCWPIPLFGRNNFEISGEIIQSWDAILATCYEGMRTKEAEDAGRKSERERERERRVEKARKTKRSKRICDLAAARTRPSRLPSRRLLSPIAGFFVVVRRCRWDRSRREESIVGDYGKPPVPEPEADQRCRLLRWRSDPREIITRPFVRPFRPDGPVSFTPVHKPFSAEAEARGGGIGSPLARGDRLITWKLRKRLETPHRRDDAGYLHRSARIVPAGLERATKNAHGIIRSD